MASVTKIKEVLAITTTAEELRKLADKVERSATAAKLGHSTLVEVWVGAGIDIEFHFDQEAIRCTRSSFEQKALA